MVIWYIMYIAGSDAKVESSPKMLCAYAQLMRAMKSFERQILMIYIAEYDLWTYIFYSSISGHEWLF